MKLKDIVYAHKTDSEKMGQDDEAVQAKYYARPCSYPIAWCAIKLKISANWITTFATLLALGGCVLIALGDYWHVLIGVVLLNIRHVLDYVDGTVARATKTVDNFGRWYDRTADEIIDVAMPVSIGVGLYLHGYGLFYLILGFVYALAHTLSALSLVHIELVYKEPPHKFYKPKFSLWYLVYKMGINLQSASVLIMLPFAILGVMNYYLIFFAFLTVCEMLAGITIRILNK